MVLQGELVIMRKTDEWGETLQLNIWCSTGTVGSYLNHPRQGKTQLFRRDVHRHVLPTLRLWPRSRPALRHFHLAFQLSIRSHGDLDQLFRNPRVHTGDGYHRKPARAEPSHPCPGCGKLCRSVSGTAGHFESGACPSCPGRDAALQAAYGQIRRLEDGAGSRGMFTSGQLALTDNYQMDQHGNLQRDWTGGYEHGGDNYSCPGCSRAFKTSQAMLQHIEARPQCRSGGFEMLGY
jgi:hypothetical protein